MIHRPVDAGGDILPVLSSSDLLRGPEAVAQLVRERLSLLAGGWWENPDWGNEILDMLEGSRMTEADRQVLAAYLSSYIRETPGVTGVRDAECSAENRKLRFRCTVDTGSGVETVSWEL